MYQECKRYGKRTDANMAHHIYPVEDYPEYDWCDWNLISLCNKCHNEMHSRNDRT
jgi:5-methylcytosine-specific restriction endonuclease McrA